MRLDALVFTDEIYEYFVYDGAQHFSPGSLPDAAEHTISLFSLSKAYGFAAWRIGYMTLPERLLTAVKKAQDTILICPPVISQEALALLERIAVSPFCSVVTRSEAKSSTAPSCTKRISTPSKVMEARSDERFDRLHHLLIQTGALIIVALIGLIATQV